ncbi:unnamed protein product [Euphydryas editha]|uniref:Transposase n=1 Tax=Euphydryas editha TaxID=104508 RepID=A0AAU9UHC6_EUPED|nr:unnamed protein product [Euphydryas editha]
MLRPISVECHSRSQDYAYLGHTIQLGRNNFVESSFRRFRRVLPVFSYGAKMWTLTTGLVHKFKVSQSAMERAMLGVSFKDKIRNEIVCDRNKYPRYPIKSPS